MFTQSKQLTAALVVSTVLTSIGLGLLVSALTCDCEHDPECAQASTPAESHEHLASAEPWGQMPPDVIELKPDSRRNEIRDDFAATKRRQRRSMVRQRAREQVFLRDFAIGGQLMDISDADLRGPRKQEKPARRALVRKDVRRKQEIADPWAD